MLGQEGVESVERPDVEHTLPGERVGEVRHPVPVVARHARRVEPMRGVEREGVEPERHGLDDARGLAPGSASMGSVSATARSASVSSGSWENESTREARVWNSCGATFPQDGPD